MISVSQFEEEGSEYLIKALEDAAHRLEQKANELWMGRRISGETYLFSSNAMYIEGFVTRVRVRCLCNDYQEPYAVADLYTTISHPETGQPFVLYVLNPSLHDEEAG